MRMQTLRVIESFMSPAEADLLRLRLEYAGIRVCLADEAITGRFWHYSNAVGGLKVLVHEDDWPAAMAALNPDAGRNTGSAGPPCASCGTAFPEDWEVCWACGATADREPNPEFTITESRAAESDPDAPPTSWWPLICLACPPLLFYEAVREFAPDLPPERLPTRKRTWYAPVDPRLAKACLCALFSIGWFSPWAFVSLYVLWSKDATSRARHPRARRLRLTAVVLDLISLDWLLLIAITFFLALR